MHNLYNFEAVFLIFIAKLNLPRKAQKVYLAFFRNFLNWLTLILKISSSPEISAAFIPFLEKSSLNKYQQFLQQSKLSKNSIRFRLQILSEFKSFLLENKTLIVTPKSSAANIFYHALIGEFTSDLKDQGNSEITLRNYKADISQFLYFLTHSVDN